MIKRKPGQSYHRFDQRCAFARARLIKPVLSAIANQTAKVMISVIALFFLAELFMGCAAQPISEVPTSTPTPDFKRTSTIFPDTLRYAVFPAPPYMIGAGDLESEMSGIDVEIMLEIGRRLGVKIEFVKCTWARCLELMKNGDADMLSSAYKKPEREAFMKYLEKPYLNQLPIAFYYLKSKQYSVDRYEDIYQFDSIGVLSNASYFERFDNDQKAKKFEVPSQDQLFPMLLAGRLDAMAGYVPTENYRLNAEGYQSQIEHSAYIFQEQALVYMTVSKKSPFAEFIEEINSINQLLLDEGFIENTVSTYYEKIK